MDHNLRDAAEEGNIDALYASIARDANVLDKIDEIPFVETPLHIAAAAGQTQFAMEMMMLKPSLARKLNPNGFTPLLLAMHNNQTQLVRGLLDVHKDLVCAQGRGGMNPLHYAAQTGNLLLLTEFLVICPKCIEDVTSRSETALHIALKNDMLDAFQLLVGWLQRAWFKNAYIWGNRILTWLDMNGNNVLHIAASKNEPQASYFHFPLCFLLMKKLFFFSFFFYFPGLNSTVDYFTVIAGINNCAPLQVVRRLLDCRVPVNRKNLEGFTALDIAQGQTQVENQEIRDMLCRAFSSTASSLPWFPYLSDYLRSPLPIYEKFVVRFLRQRTLLPNDFRNMVLVVAVLLVTIAYQAILSTPGGFWQDNQFNITAATSARNEVSQVPHRVGTVTMARQFFPLLVAVNTLTFYIPLLLMILVLPHGLPGFLLVVSFGFLFLSYGTTIAITAPLPSYWLHYFLFFSFFLVTLVG